MTPLSGLVLRAAPLLLVACLVGCASSSPSPAASNTNAPTSHPESPVTHASSSPPRTPPRSNAVDIADGEAIPAGRVSFTGMVTPVKDGFSVRGVVVPDALREALRDAHDGVPEDPGWFLGANVKLTGTVVSHDDGPRGGRGAVVEQGHEGRWLAMSEVEGAELVAMPVVVEGTLSRSKGLFQIGEYLVTKADLAWSLVSTGGGKEGDRVRLYGQPRTYRCDPREQCLSGGSIPMFDVGRAEKL